MSPMWGGAQAKMQLAGRLQLQHHSSVDHTDASLLLLQPNVSEDEQPDALSEASSSHTR